ncbi:hypothetical protein JCM33374_g4539 [Metschnikowia sp. JCM 33374]|nr:hypothetical protein JCM33374_g4539 [Metschnikowia sp. JCM 33374]
MDLIESKSVDPHFTSVTSPGGDGLTKRSTILLSETDMAMVWDNVFEASLQRIEDILYFLCFGSISGQLQFIISILKIERPEPISAEPSSSIAAVDWLRYTLFSKFDIPLINFRLRSSRIFLLTEPSRL